MQNPILWRGVAAFALIALSGCAKHANEIPAAYISPETYRGYSCEQAHAELQRIQLRVNELTGKQNDEATGDTIKMTIGLILFWPTLFFLEGDTETQGELSRLKGEYETLRVVLADKDCG